MGGRTSDWQEELGRFLEPFLARLGRNLSRRDATGAQIRDRFPALTRKRDRN